MVRDRIAEWLDEKVRRTAIQQYVAILAGRAEIVGIDIAASPSPSCSEGAAILLGTILKRLDDDGDAAVALEAMGDIVLLTEVATMAAAYDETVGNMCPAPPVASPPMPPARIGWPDDRHRAKRRSGPCGARAHGALVADARRRGPAASGCNCRDGGPGDDPR